MMSSSNIFQLWMSAINRQSKRFSSTVTTMNGTTYPLKQKELGFNWMMPTIIHYQTFRGKVTIKPHSVIEVTGSIYGNQTITPLHHQRLPMFKMVSILKTVEKITSQKTR